MRAAAAVDLFRQRVTAHNRGSPACSGPSPACCTAAAAASWPAPSCWWWSPGPWAGPWPGCWTPTTTSTRRRRRRCRRARRSRGRPARRPRPTSSRSSGSGRPPRRTAGQATLQGVVRAAQGPEVARVDAYRPGGPQELVSRDGRSTLRRRDPARRRGRRRASSTGWRSGPASLLGGGAVMQEQAGEQVQEDLARAELLAFPLLFLVSLLVFRGLVAALLPLAVGMTTVLTTFLLMRGVNAVEPMSIFALNLIIGLGLGLAIDYSLFIVSRFREELERGRDDRRRARRRRCGPPGGRCCSAPPPSPRRSPRCWSSSSASCSRWASAAILVTLVAATVSLTILPALLAALGPRVNALSPARWRAAIHREAARAESGFWYRLSRWVMRRAARRRRVHRGAADRARAAVHADPVHRRRRERARRVALRARRRRRAAHRVPAQPDDAGARRRDRARVGGGRGARLRAAARRAARACSPCRSRSPRAGCGGSASWRPASGSTRRQGGGARRCAPSTRRSAVAGRRLDGGVPRPAVGARGPHPARAGDPRDDDARHPVPDDRVGRAPRQDADHEPADAQRRVRDPHADLPGRPAGGPARLHEPGRAGVLAADPAVRDRLRALDRLRRVPAHAHQGGARRRPAERRGRRRRPPAHRPDRDRGGAAVLHRDRRVRDLGDGLHQAARARHRARRADRRDDRARAARAVADAAARASGTGGRRAARAAARADRAAREPRDAWRRRIPFDADTALEPAGDGRWRAWPPEHWFVARGPNGGYLAAVAGARRRGRRRAPAALAHAALRRAAPSVGPLDVRRDGRARGRPLLRRDGPHRAGGAADDARARHARRAARGRAPRGTPSRAPDAAAAGDDRAGRRPTTPDVPAFMRQLRHALGAAGGRRRARLGRLDPHARAARARRAARGGDDRRVGAGGVRRARPLRRSRRRSTSRSTSAARSRPPG